MGTAQQLLLGGGGGGAADPYFSSVVLLCHADGADGVGTPTNVVQALGRGEIMSGAGGMQFDTDQALFGPSSMLIGNNVTQYVKSDSHADYAFGTGDFTIEFALRTATLAADIVFDMRPASTNGAYAALSMSSGGDLYYYVSSAIRITGTAVLTTNTWQRVAVSRVSGTTRMFVDGTQVGSSWTDSTNYAQSRIVFGASSYTLGNDPYNGWVDEMRITKGVGRYAGSYTVDASAFPDY